MKGKLQTAMVNQRVYARCKVKDDGRDQAGVLASEAQPMRERGQESVEMRAAKGMPQVMERRRVLGSQTLSRFGVESVGMQAAKGMPHNADRRQNCDAQHIENLGPVLHALPGRLQQERLQRLQKRRPRKDSPTLTKILVNAERQRHKQAPCIHASKASMFTTMVSPSSSSSRVVPWNSPEALRLLRAPGGAIPRHGAMTTNLMTDLGQPRHSSQGNGTRLPQGSVW